MSSSLLSSMSQVEFHVSLGAPFWVTAQVCGTRADLGCERVARIGTNFEGFIPAWCTTGAGVRWTPGVRSGFPCLLEEFESPRQLCSLWRRGSLGKMKSQNGICLGEFPSLPWRT